MGIAHSDRKLCAADGTELYLHRWQPKTAAVKAELMMLHGYAGHGARYQEMAHALCAEGIACTAIDVRGHGKAAGRRGYCSAFTDYHLDVDTLWKEVATDGPKRFLFGHSHGGLIALHYLDARKRQIDGLVLSNPFTELALEVSSLKKAAGRLLSRIAPKMLLPNDLNGDLVTHDPQRARAYESDPLIFGSANARWFVECTAAQVHVRGLKAFDAPLLFTIGDADPIADPLVNKRLAEQLVCSDKTVDIRVGRLHELWNEDDRKDYFASIAKWLLARC